MPCGRHGGDDGEESTRRSFLRSAVAAGGASALAACVDLELDGDAPETQSVPQGREDLSTLPERQHAWNDYLPRDRFGNTKVATHQTLLLLRYTGDGPTAAEREAVERAFRTLERAYQRGTGGGRGAITADGLLFAIGYAPRWFDRFDADLPASLDLPRPEAVIDELDEDAEADDYDAVIHMSSGLASVLLSAERALTGEVDRVNGVPVEGDLTTAFDVAERRTGFIGQGQPARNYDVDAISESAPLSMGFNAIFTDNNPPEDRATLLSGPFAGGTTMEVSPLSIDLESWYERPEEDRVGLMFSPHHDPGHVGEFGENLAGASGLAEDYTEDLEAEAAEHGMLGHGQKLAAARDDDFEPTILRRDFDANDAPGNHFVSCQRGIEDFVDVRKAMNGDGVDADIDAHHDGILEFVEVQARGTYLVPPRSLRTMPPPRP